MGDGSLSMVVVVPLGATRVTVGVKYLIANNHVDAMVVQYKCGVDDGFTRDLSVGFGLYLAAWGLGNLPSDHIRSLSEDVPDSVGIKGEGDSGLRVRA